MTKFEVYIILAVFLTVNVTDTTVMITDITEVLHDVNDRIYAAIGDLFINLKINSNFTKSKMLEEFMTAHSYIQEELPKQHKVFEEIHNIIKTNISKEIADKISGVNDVLDEMIREYTVENIDSIRNYTKTYSTQHEKDFVDIKKVFSIKLKTDLMNNTTIIHSNTSGVQGRRIFAGKDTPIKRYPFIVSVHVARRFVCAGSLLHESLALSAASCVMRTQQNPKAPVQIRIGSDYVTKMGSLVHIEEILYHPEFDRSTLANNLAFLRTKRALRFVQEKVVAIKYDKYDSAMLRGGKDIVILGWGRRSESEKATVADRPLSRAHLDLYDLEECKYIYTREYIADTNFCAGFTDRGDGACNHDGGGPAVAGSLLTGVISFGAPQCGRADAPTVFTRLALYAVWIDSVLDTVKIPKGSKTNPQTFEVPTSVEFGNGKNEEINIEDTEGENPRDTIKKEFGLVDILNGPIDKSNKWGYKNKSGLPKEESKAKMKKSSTLASDINVAKLPGTFVKSTLGPTAPILKPDEIITVVLENEEIGDGQKESEAGSILIADNTESEKVGSTKIIEVTTGMTETIAVYGDEEFECDSANTTQTNQIVSVIDPTKNETFDMLTMENSDSSDESNGNCDDNELQTSDESENENGNSPILEENTTNQVKNDKAFIVMVDSGTTKRIDLDKRDIMYGKVVRVMKALVKAADNNRIR